MAPIFSIHPNLTHSLRAQTFCICLNIFLCSLISKYYFSSLNKVILLEDATQMPLGARQAAYVSNWENWRPIYPKGIPI